jgi:N-methylhydantoinase A
VWREYERVSTTVVSAYITPIVSTYVSQLTGALRQEGVHVPVYITQSNGGVMAANIAARQAVVTLFSGPVGGVMGARAAGNDLGIGDLISIDVGGTSFDVSLVRNGDPTLQSEFELQGLPVLAPAVEVHTIGAGGGSLIQNRNGALRVGPESAGAAPGPACYGLGGVEPTLTDANVVLGRLPSSQRLAGRMQLDAVAAEAALTRVGESFGLSATELAEQALEVAHFAMAEAIRELTVERGLDPREFLLCAFGGAGGLHATALADELEIGRVLVPGIPGAFSAWGMLQGEIRHDTAQTFYRPLDGAGNDLPDVVSTLKERTSSTLETNHRGGTPRFEVAADLRYVGQEYALTLPLSAGEISEIDSHTTALARRFHGAYSERYGHASAEEPIEFVALRVAAIATLERPTRNVRPTGEDGDRRNDARVPIRFAGQDWEAELHERQQLSGRVTGPAVVLEETCTTVVPPGWIALPVDFGHLLLERA